MPLQMNSGNGGPWGGGGTGGGNRGGGNGGSPWGSGGGGPRGGGPRGQGPNPQDMERMVREGQEKLKEMMPGGLGGKGIFLIVALAAAIWLGTGFYTVEPDEQGVELVFGKLSQTTGSGLNYNYPAPIGEVLKPKITTVNQVEIGFRTSSNSRSNISRDLTNESLMLTGDENIVDVQFVVQWLIADAGKFLFNVRNPEQSVKSAAEAAMREVIGKSEFKSIRTGGRAQIAADTKDLLQEILDSYGAGIAIQSVNIKKADPPAQVIDAFRDVQAASADKERAINEATAYKNEVTEKALGQAEQVTRAAEAYREEKIAAATGDASRFLQVYEEYKGAEEITKRRIYLQTMEEVLGGMDKVLIEEGENGSGVLPYLPLNELKKSN
ncbi:FtsH protease activity modulator HflK [Curvivirga sp.]|uniref:FtsH protease activity modulator HflK n=1 Tax=Curvivirga sp. TaxID=2856848 RepID=UPI003B5B74B6